MTRFINVFMFLSLGFMAFSQKTQGRISYDVYVSSDDPQVSSYVEKMEGSVLELYYGMGNVRTEMYFGDMMTTINVSRKDNDTSLTLLDGMMGKIAFKNTLEDLDEEHRLAISERNVELVDGSKEIMGYACKKAIVTTPDENEAVIWYTTELLPEFRGGAYLYEEIPGVPLEMSSSWGKMDMKIVAFDYSKKLKKPEELFSLEVPKDYTLKTAEEMKQMRGGKK